jgi:hypothetical protein
VSATSRNCSLAADNFDANGFVPRRVLLRLFSACVSGFGGGNNISNNLLFQTCGESGDHGAINTWDRQAFLTTVATGKPSIVPAETNIHNNFIVSDYDANGGMIDNDDGSSFYNEYNNFGIYGGAKMGNIDGHGKRSHHNVFAFPNVYGKNCFWNWCEQPRISSFSPPQSLFFLMRAKMLL